MSKRPTTDDELPPLSPEMQALASDRQRAFVRHFCDAPLMKRGRALWAARKAGYGRSDGSSSNRALSAIAGRLLGDEQIKRAIHAETDRRYYALAPAALTAAERAINDPTHKDHGRMVDLALSHSHPVASQHNIRVEHEHAHRFNVEDVTKVRQRIHELARRAGLLPPPAEPIEGEFSVVDQGTAS